MNTPPSTMRIGVFCGARPGASAEYVRLATDFGGALARRGAALVYGAGGAGVMGSMARAAFAGGAAVLGVIPRDLRDRERAQLVYGELHVVEGMHERKSLMYQNSDAFAVLPGGLGTLDELIEVSTWNQLGYHSKPVVLVNRGNFFAPLIELLDYMLEQEFVTAAERSLIQDTDDVEKALDLLGCSAKEQ